MGFILIFKDISADQLMSISNPDTPEKIRMLNDARKFKIGDVIKITDSIDSGRQAHWQIVSINESFVNSGVFDQPEPIMKYEFTMNNID